MCAVYSWEKCNLKTLFTGLHLPEYWCHIHIGVTCVVTYDSELVHSFWEIKNKIKPFFQNRMIKYGWEESFKLHLIFPHLVWNIGFFAFARVFFAENTFSILTHASMCLLLVLRVSRPVPTDTIPL